MLSMISLDLLKLVCKAAREPKFFPPVTSAVQVMASCISFVKAVSESGEKNNVKTLYMLSEPAEKWMKEISNSMSNCIREWLKTVLPYNMVASLSKPISFVEKVELKVSLL